MLRLQKRVALRDEIVRHAVKRVLILDARRDHLLNEPVLVKLLAVRQHVGHDRDADRAAPAGCRSYQACRLTFFGHLTGIGLDGPQRSLSKELGAD